MRLALPGLVATLLASAGCTSEYHPEYHPQTSYAVSQTVSYPTTTIFQVGGATPALASGAAVAPAPPEDEPSPGPEPRQEGAPSRVLVLESQQLDRPGEVVGVVDVDVAPDAGHDAVIEVLRRRAAAMGADAIVGVEIHHAGGAMGHGRASGLAVRLARSRGG